MSNSLANSSAPASRSIDLNVDAGEREDAAQMEEDRQLLASVSSANIACGYHAGNARVMRRTVEWCAELGVAVGAHPGLPDREGFGRRELAVAPAEVEADVLYQLGALQAIAKAAGVPLVHVKPHGALYHMASRRRDLAEAIVRAARAIDPGLAIVGPAASELLRAATAAGLRPVEEGFVDRAYLADGSLAPRSLSGAVHADESAAIGQALSIAERGEARALDGGVAIVKARTLCLHGDTPGAAAFAASLRRSLLERGYAIRPPR
ncbi:5-oxoprolinase subunit PxpA [Cohnella fermenti]|uniref:LamB/YcsF family protein n=1 Tax=Cohnella fermenti TaxID=2565925 RepID=A0A4S4BG03_9BACL|nr:5-oxoprolinase subunit PxpA [Cohnella fermenti]THF73194.1 LamB/YcsF family protein [Cohnella fermenti]